MKLYQPIKLGGEKQTLCSNVNKKCSKCLFRTFFYKER